MIGPILKVILIPYPVENPIYGEQ